MLTYRTDSPNLELTTQDLWEKASDDDGTEFHLGKEIVIATTRLEQVIHCFQCELF